MKKDCVYYYMALPSQYSCKPVCNDGYVYGALEAVDMRDAKQHLTDTYGAGRFIVIENRFTPAETTIDKNVLRRRFKMLAANSPWKGKI